MRSATISLSHMEKVLNTDFYRRWNNEQHDFLTPMEQASVIKFLEMTGIETTVIGGKYHLEKEGRK